MMDARRRFEATREAVRDLRAVQLALSEEGDDWRPDSVKGVGPSDPTAARAAYDVDVLGPRIEGLRAWERELLDVIGATGEIIEGVRRGLGDEYADILEQRYIDCLPWSEVEVDGRRVARSTGKLRVAVACDWIDSLGVSRVLRGEFEV